MASVFLEGSASGQIPGPCQGNQLDREIERDICHWEDESGSVQCVTAPSSCGIMLNKCQLHSCFHLTLCSSHPAIQADSLSALLLGGITEFIFNLRSHCQWLTMPAVVIWCLTPTSVSTHCQPLCLSSLCTRDFFPSQQIRAPHLFQLLFYLYLPIQVQVSSREGPTWHMQDLSTMENASGSVSISLSDSILGFVLTSQGMIEFWMYVLDWQIQIRHFGSCVQYIGMDLNVLAKW